MTVLDSIPSQTSVMRSRKTTSISYTLLLRLTSKEVHAMKLIAINFSFRLIFHFLEHVSTGYSRPGSMTINQINHHYKTCWFHLSHTLTLSMVYNVLLSPSQHVLAYLVLMKIWSILWELSNWNELQRTTKSFTYFDYFSWRWKTANFVLF